MLNLALNQVHALKYTEKFIITKSNEFMYTCKTVTNGKIETPTQWNEPKESQSIVSVCVRNTKRT